jgi:hypothetical protein
MSFKPRCCVVGPVPFRSSGSGRGRASLNKAVSGFEPSITIGHIAGRLQELNDATNGNDMMSIFGSKPRSNHPKYQPKRCTTTQHRTRRITTLEHPLAFRDQGVGGSNPLAPTISSHWLVFLNQAITPSKGRSRRGGKLWKSGNIGTIVQFSHHVWLLEQGDLRRNLPSEIILKVDVSGSCLQVGVPYRHGWELLLSTSCVTSRRCSVKHWGYLQASRSALHLGVALRNVRD